MQPDESADRAEDEGSGSTLANFAEVMLPCLDAISAETVIEVGAYRGEFTSELLNWAEARPAKIVAVEPDPPSELRELDEGSSGLTLAIEKSFEALLRLPPADAVIIDGDHNYYTVSEELRIISDRAKGSVLPLIFLHDVCWPYARRDGYYAPEEIPEEHRHPLARELHLVPPDEDGVFLIPADREGGPRNGVLTAVEDFMSNSQRLRLAIVPVFFGLGVLWSEDAPWAGEVAEIVEPWDSNPMLQRLEADRVANLVDRSRLEHQRVLLRALLNSRAFAVAEQLSRLRQGGRPVVSREQLRQELDASPTQGGPRRGPESPRTNQREGPGGQRPG